MTSPQPTVQPGRGTAELEFHEAANWFPMMDDAALRDLADDIKANGQLEPISLYQDKILDGRNRYRACRMVEVEPKTADVDPKDPAEFVLSRNLHRRHLTAGQRAMIGAKLKELYAAEAKERAGTRTDLKGDFPDGVGGQARDKAGEAVGVDGKTIDKAAKVLTNGSPELIKAVESGKLDLTKAAKIADLPKEKQETILEDAHRNEWTPAQTVQEAMRLQPKSGAKGPPKPPKSNAMQYANQAIAQLGQIDPADSQREEAFARVAEWIEENR